VKFFDQNKDYDPDTQSVKPTWKAYTNKIDCLSKEVSLAKIFSKFDKQQKKQQLIKFERRDTLADPNDYLRELLIKTLSAEALTSLNIKPLPVTEPMQMT